MRYFGGLIIVMIIWSLFEFGTNVCIPITCSPYQEGEECFDQIAGSGNSREYVGLTYSSSYGQCPSDQYCIRSHPCQNLKVLSASCSKNEECKSGLCIESQCSTTLRVEGEACGDSSHCSLETFCGEFSVCELVHPSGSVCESDDECELETLCYESVCTPIFSIPIGSPMSEYKPFVCESGYFYQGYCIAREDGPALQGMASKKKVCTAQYECTYLVKGVVYSASSIGQTCMMNYKGDCENKYCSYGGGEEVFEDVIRKVRTYYKWVQQNNRRDLVYWDYVSVQGITYGSTSRFYYLTVLQECSFEYYYEHLYGSRHLCSDGEYLDSEKYTCEECDSGCSSCLDGDSGSSCTECIDGKWLQFINSTVSYGKCVSACSPAYIYQDKYNKRCWTDACPQNEELCELIEVEEEEVIQETTQEEEQEQEDSETITITEEKIISNDTSFLTKDQLIQLAIYSSIGVVGLVIFFVIFCTVRKFRKKPKKAIIHTESIFKYPIKQKMETTPVTDISKSGNFTTRVLHINNRNSSKIILPKQKEGLSRKPSFLETQLTRTSSAALTPYNQSAFNPRLLKMRSITAQPSNKQ